MDPSNDSGEAPRPSPIIEVKDLYSGYGSTVLNAHVNFTVQPGEIFGILGGSGCGKTTLLKNMIGLLPPLRGQVFIQEDDLWGCSARARRKLMQRFGVMYQQGALFGSLSLLDNVSLPLEEHTRLPPRARRKIAAAKLQMVDLSGYEDYLPEEISGGMRKRAAIARALALDPEIIFFDEPSAGLDPITSNELDRLIMRLSRVLNITFVIVTHELASIFAIIDRAIVLDKDAIGVVATGNPRDLRDHSEDPFVRRFFHRGEKETA